MNVLAAAALWALLFLLPSKARATYIVFDPTNWAENVLKELQETEQTGIQNAISATVSTISGLNSTISQYTQYIYNLKNQIQQATGTVTGAEQLLGQLYSQIVSIPNSFQSAFTSILSLPQQFQNGAASSWKNWYSSNDPITRYLGGALSELQTLLGLINGASPGTIPGNWTTFNSPAYAANLSQVLGAHALKTEPSALLTINTLQNQAKNAKTLQAGKAVENQTKIQQTAAQNQINQLTAARQLELGQDRTNEIKRYNTNLAGVEASGGAAFYNTFSP